MKKLRIIIADEDYSYIIPLQLHFIEEMFEKINLEIITDREYFCELFSSPQSIDILIVSEDLYSSNLQKHEIKHVFLMRESPEMLDISEHFVSIYKYTNIKEIFSIMQGKIDWNISEIEEMNDNPQIVLVTSAAGGVGKTTVAMGIASVLSSRMKRVLYMNVDHLQTFHGLLFNRMPINDNGLYMQLSASENDVFSKLKHLIRKEDFYYIPPFKGALMTLGIKHSIGIELAKQAKISREYDFVIVDADSACDTDKIQLLEIADKIIFVTTQTDASIFALNCFLGSVDLPDKEKVMYVCNKFDPSERNAILEPEMEITFYVNEYIEKMANYLDQKDTKFSDSPGINKLAMMLI